MICDPLQKAGSWEGGRYLAYSRCYSSATGTVGQKNLPRTRRGASLLLSAAAVQYSTSRETRPLRTIGHETQTDTRTALPRRRHRRHENPGLAGRRIGHHPRPPAAIDAAPKVPAARNRSLPAWKSVMKAVLAEAKLETTDLTAIGVAVPGVVEPKSGNVVVTPNMGLTGVSIGGAPGEPLPRAGGHRQRRQPGHVRRGLAGFRPQGRSALGIWVGTGIGAGFVHEGQGRRGAASRPARSGTSSCRSAARFAAAAITAAWRPWPAARPSSATSARPWPPAARAN